MAALLDQPRTYNAALDAVVPGAFCYFYLNGTSTPTPVYANLRVRLDPDNPEAWLGEVSNEHPNPLRSDSAGRLPAIFRSAGTFLRMVMTDADGNELHDLQNFTTFPGPDLITPLTDGGEPMPFATITVYKSRTTEVSAEYTANADGVFEVIELVDTELYRIILRTAAGELVYDYDPYPGSGAFVGGGGGDECMCPPRALVYFEQSGDIQQQENVVSVDWDCGAVGQYQINFAAVFSTPPIITANVVGESEVPQKFVVIGEVTAAYARITVYDHTGAAANAIVMLKADQIEGGG